jgi:N-acyl homoserine lactone hydrolase
MTSIARLLAKFAIGACAVAGLASQAPAASPDGMKLYVFTSYPLDISKAALSSAATGDEKIIVPVGFFLIKHPKGNIMFDTGDNDKLVADKTYWGPMAAMLDKGVDPNLSIDAQLGKLGMKASDINYVILGHMHLDHAGNVSKFPNATIVVQRDEIINAFWPPKAFAGPYISGDFETLRAQTGSHRLANNRRSSSTAISTCSETVASSFIARLATLPEANWRLSVCPNPAP